MTLQSHQNFTFYTFYTEYKIIFQYSINIQLPEFMLVSHVHFHISIDYLGFLFYDYPDPIFYEFFSWGNL